MIEGNALWLVKRNEGTHQKLQMLLFERNGKAIDNATENFQEFTDTIVTFRLVHKAVKDVGNGATDKGTVRHEFSINAMQYSLEVVTFPRIFGIKQFHQLKTKLLIDIFFGRLGIHFGTHNESKEELVGNLQMRPCRFQDGFIFFWIKVIRRRRKCSTDIGRNTRHEVAHDGFRKNLLTCRSIDIIHQFQQGLTLHILASFIRSGIIKRKDNTAKL
mmetsp:Transcript_14387/g.26026  ORF Transcript_14387/g.26026 Transcript_14387/m.26026 type:complete len:216 (+) Transcript_14387:620-1267(+)